MSALRRLPLNRRDDARGFFSRQRERETEKKKEGKRGQKGKGVFGVSDSMDA